MSRGVAEARVGDCEDKSMSLCVSVSVPVPVSVSLCLYACVSLYTGHVALRRGGAARRLRGDAHPRVRQGAHARHGLEGWRGPRRQAPAPSPRAADASRALVMAAGAGVCGGGSDSGKATRRMCVRRRPCARAHPPHDGPLPQPLQVSACEFRRNACRWKCTQAVR